MDADKEGFLRSTQSLIQTMGRAARNLEGKAILYADKITGSMKRAMDETERRREKQIEFNKENGITPKSIVKKITDIMEAARSVKPLKMPALKVAEPKKPYAAMTEVELMKEIDRLEKEMYQLAQDLEFEEAAKIRDFINELNEKVALSK